MSEMVNSPDELCYRSARDLMALIKQREISCCQVMECFLDRIGRVNPEVNAICTLRPVEDLLREAQLADKILENEQTVPHLHGLPLAVKDLALTRDLKTTFGSPIYADHIPSQDQLFVERLRASGAIIIGKTNTPEFGAGSHTFNPVHGITRNPYDATRTAGGSSGGAAAALAAGMVPLADGSDLGGSLRNPAGFCNVVGMRPSPGRVPTWPSLHAWDSMAVEGALGRTVEDVALLLSVMAGPDPRAPISIDEPGAVFLNSLECDFENTMIAWSPDLGKFAVENEIVSVCESSLGSFGEFGCRVAKDQPAVGNAMEAFQVLRAFLYGQLEQDYIYHSDLMKDTVAWNIEKGLEQKGIDVYRAEVERSEFYHRVREFLELYDFLLVPSTQVTPFPVEQEWVTEINGVSMETYIDWMAINCVISLTGLPAISVPCGFTAAGMPVGLQIIGRHHADFSVLQLAHAFEKATGYYRIRPEIEP